MLKGIMLSRETILGHSEYFKSLSNAFEIIQSRYRSDYGLDQELPGVKLPEDWEKTRKDESVYVDQLKQEVFDEFSSVKTIIQPDYEVSRYDVEIGSAQEDMQLLYSYYREQREKLLPLIQGKREIPVFNGTVEQKTLFSLQYKVFCSAALLGFVLQVEGLNLSSQITIPVSKIFRLRKDFVFVALAKNKPISIGGRGGFDTAEETTFDLVPF